MIALRRTLRIIEMIDMIGKSLGWKAILSSFVSKHLPIDLSIVDFGALRILL